MSGNRNTVTHFYGDDCDPPHVEIYANATVTVRRLGGGTQKVKILNVIPAYDENGRDYARFVTEDGRVGFCAVDTMEEVTL